MAVGFGWVKLGYVGFCSGSSVLLCLDLFSFVMFGSVLFWQLGWVRLGSVRLRFVLVGLAGVLKL